MSLYQNSNYTEPYPAGQRVTLPLGSALHVGVSINEMEMERFVVVLDTHSPNPDDPMRYFIIQNNVEHRGESRNKPGLQRYASEVTLDPSAAHSFLSLSEENRKVTHQRKEQQYPITQERFDECNQVLCKECLRGQHYLEVECVHDVHIVMAYKQIERKGAGDNVTLGRNAVSWILYASNNKFHAQHGKIIHNLRVPEIKSNESYRIGVFLDCPAGILPFYSISCCSGSESDKQTHLYTFHTRFTETLYLGLRLQSPTATISSLQYI